MLNAAQKDAVETLSGPLLVLAGAGTGKTRVVTYRIARLIQSGIAPERILAVTFTNKAAKEMQERVARKIGNSGKERPEISTFHSLCVRILHRQIHHLGYPNHFSIYDQGDQDALARKILRDIRVSSKAITPGDLVKRIGQWKTSSITAQRAMDHLEDPSRDYIAAVAYNRYQDALKTLGAVDFDDLLLLTEELFTRFPDVLLEESRRYDRILVDEYQDTNMSQYRIIKALAIQHRNLCVVGDDDQAIYGWRGAEVTHILNFKRDWPDARVVRLEMNYRSTKPIIDWANRLIVFNRERHSKELHTNQPGETPRILQCSNGEAEAKTVVSEIGKLIEHYHRKPRDFAVLFRTNEQPRAFEMEFRSAKIPYTLIGGQSFFDRKEVKDIISYLKVLAYPRDSVALLRIINTPNRGIGPGTVRRITQTALEDGKSPWDIMNDSEYIQQFDTKSAESLKNFCRMIREEGGKLRRNFTSDAVSSYIERINYKREIEHNWPEEDDRTARWNCVGEVVSAAASFLGSNPHGTLTGFLDNTALGGIDFNSGNDKKLERNAVVLMTYHAAKGLEFPEVYMVGMEEGILPHHRSVDDINIMAIDEERRLCYVGITRACRKLTMTLALERLKWGKMRPTFPSRFLYEVTGQADNPNYEKIKNKKR